MDWTTAIDMIKRNFQTSKLHIPHNPNRWLPKHVSKCLGWIVKNFNIVNDDYEPLASLSGSQLLYVRTLNINATTTTSSSILLLWSLLEMQINKYENRCKLLRKHLDEMRCTIWQFLIDVLLDKNYTDAIAWHGDHDDYWKFEIYDHDEIARLWGIRKKLPASMSNLKRALLLCRTKCRILERIPKKNIYRFTIPVPDLLLNIREKERTRQWNKYFKMWFRYVHC